MLKNDIKKDNFKTSSTPLQGVRLTHSSDEASVMDGERRGKQSSLLNDDAHTSNYTGSCGDKWKGQPFLNRWLRISLRAQKENSVFNNLLLHVNEETLLEAFNALDGSKAMGVDKVSKSAYGKNLEANIRLLAKRVKDGSYRPLPKREVQIPKANGKTRPIAIACFEDKIVDWVAAKLLNQVFDPCFIPNSFGFREKKSAHQAIEACYHSLKDNKRPFVVEIDFSNFFNTISHKKLMKVVEKKVKDYKFLGLIRTFLKSQTIVDGELVRTTCGTPQGGLMSPILANIYLNEVVDQWFVENYQSHNNKAVRYADDAVFFFKKEEDANKFLSDFKQRVSSFDLIINEDKSNSLSFKKSEFTSFNFLGFTFYWGKNCKRRILKVKTEKSKLHKSMKEFYSWIKENRNRYKLSVLWETANAKLRGHYNYFGYWMNYKKLNHFYWIAVKSLFKWLNRRSQKKSYNWENFKERLKNQPLLEPPSTNKLRNLGTRYAYNN